MMLYAKWISSVICVSLNAVIVSLVGIWPHTPRRRLTSVHFARRCFTVKITLKTTCRLTTPTKRPLSVKSVANTITQSWDTSGIWPCTQPPPAILPVRFACKATRAHPHSWSTWRATRASLQGAPRKKNTPATTAIDASIRERTFVDTWWCTRAAKTSCASTAPSALGGRTIWRGTSRRATRRSCWRSRRNRRICWVSSGPVRRLVLWKKK